MTIYRWRIDTKIQNMGKKNKEKAEELVNDAHVEVVDAVNEPALNEVKVEEKLNEVFELKDAEAKVIQDVPSVPVLSVKQRYQKMVEGKNFELSVSGKTIYSSKSNVKFSMLEDGVMIDRQKYSYSGLTFRIK